MLPLAGGALGEFGGTWRGSRRAGGPLPSGSWLMLLPSPGRSPGGSLWMLSLPPAPSQRGMEILPGFDATSPSSQAVQELVLAGVFKRLDLESLHCSSDLIVFN